MDYVKTFILVAVFLFLAFFNILNVIRHHREGKESRAEAKAKKKAAKEEKKLKRRLRMMGVKYEPVEEKKDEVREYDLVEEEEDDYISEPEDLN